jgi:hypothetical protein
MPNLEWAETLDAGVSAATTGSTHPTAQGKLKSKTTT